MVKIKHRLVLLVSLLAVSCGGDDGDGGGDCVSGDSVPGEPDMVAAPSLSMATATLGDTFTVSIPVDADTGYVTLNVFDSNRTVTLGGDFVVTSGNETVEISLDVEDGILGPVVAGGYFPIINVCTDEDACLVDQVGVAYAPEQMTVTGGRFSRVEYEGVVRATSAQTCYDVELLQVTLP